MPKKRDPRLKKERTKKSRSLAPWLVASLIFVLFLVLLEGGKGGFGREEMRLDQFWQHVKDGEVARVTFLEGRAKGHVVLDSNLKKKIPVNFHSPEHASTSLERLTEEYPAVAYGVEEVGMLRQMLPYFLPLLLLILLFYFFFFRQLRSPGGIGGSLLSFGKSRARLASKEENRVTFADVAGVDEAKEELEEIIEFLKNPSKFQRLGGRAPRGVHSGSRLGQ